MKFITGFLNTFQHLILPLVSAADPVLQLSNSQGSCSLMELRLPSQWQLQG